MRQKPDTSSETTNEPTRVLLIISNEELDSGEGEAIRKAVKPQRTTLESSTRERIHQKECKGKLMIEKYF